MQTKLIIKFTMQTIKATCKLTQAPARAARRRREGGWRPRERPEVSRLRQALRGLSNLVRRPNQIHYAPNSLSNLLCKPNFLSNFLCKPNLLSNLNANSIEYQIYYAKSPRLVRVRHSVEGGAVGALGRARGSDNAGEKAGCEEGARCPAPVLCGPR